MFTVHSQYEFARRGLPELYDCLLELASHQRSVGAETDPRSWVQAWSTVVFRESQNGRQGSKCKVDISRLICAQNIILSAF